MTLVFKFLRLFEEYSKMEIKGTRTDYWIKRAFKVEDIPDYNWTEEKTSDKVKQFDILLKGFYNCLKTETSKKYWKKRIDTFIWLLAEHTTEFPDQEIDSLRKWRFMPKEQEKHFFED